MPWEKEKYWGKTETYSISSAMQQQKMRRNNSINVSIVRLRTTNLQCQKFTLKKQISFNFLPQHIKKNNKNKEQYIHVQCQIRGPDWHTKNPKDENFEK